MHIGVWGLDLSIADFVHFRNVEMSTHNPPLVGIKRRAHDGGTEATWRFSGMVAFKRWGWAGGLRWMCVLVGAMGAVPAQAGTALPQRNVLVEWRLNSSSDQQAGGLGLRSGEVVVDLSLIHI